ncbi:MAG: hypothetical protein AAGL23_16410, partial [Pseudomonadota bacterium]
RFARIAAIILGSVFLMGCADVSDINTPPVEFEYAEQFDQKRLLDQGTELPFRAYAKPEQGQGQRGPEIVGARCQMTSQEFKAAFSTPAKVTLPVIRGEPSVMTVACTANGKTTKRTQRPFKPQTVVVGDPVTAVVGTLIGAAVTAASDRWHYVYQQTELPFVMD